MSRRRLLTEYIRDDADEELDYFTIIPYAEEGESYTSRIKAYGYNVKMKDGTEYESDMWYSLDGGEWTQTFGEYIDVPCFSKIRFKSNWHEMMKDVEFPGFEYVESYYSAEFYSESGYDWWLLEGTPLSLLHGDNFKERKNEWDSYWDTFVGVFYQNKNVAQINNPKTFLPSTELSDWCYQGMFESSKIMNAPELPAETLKIGCYAEMFRYCSYLEEAPALNAKTLVPQCYNQMFYASNLRYVKMTATDGFDAEYAIHNMFSYNAPNGLAVFSKELIKEGYDEYFFEGWTVVSDDYPTNDEGYPETKGDISQYYALCLNADFRERFYDEYDQVYLNYYLSDANEEGRQLYELLTSWMIKFEAVNIGGIYVNRHRPTEMIWLEYEENGILEEWIQFNFDGRYGRFYGRLNPDGSFYFTKEEYLIYDQIKK